MRRAAGLLVVTALVAPGVALVARADAVPASEQGWWTTTNVSDTAGGVPPVPAPDVPADGLLVEGGTGSATGAADSSPTAYAALVYDVADGSVPERLELTVAPGSASVPDAVLQLCPLTSTTFPPAQGGPMSVAPAYECHRSTTAAPAPGTGAYDFTVTDLETSGVVAVAVLPTSPTDRVVLSRPGTASLTTRSTVAPVPTPNSAPPTRSPVLATPASTFGAAAAAVAENPVAGGLTALAPLPAAVSAPPAGAPAPALAPAAPTPPAPPAVEYTATPTVTVPEPRAARLLILGGIAALAAVLWGAAGRLAVHRARARTGAG